MFSFIFINGNSISHAESISSADHGFTIEIPDDWSEGNTSKNTLFAYKKKGSATNLNIIFASVQDIDSIKQISIEALYQPYSGDMIIIEETDKNVSGIDVRKLIFKFKDGENKKKLEGKNRLQFYVIQWVRNEKVFILTFTDLENDFPNNIVTFKKIADSITFQ